MMRDKGQSIIELVDDYVAIDLETTGKIVGFDEIVEIGAIKVRNGVEVDRFDTLVKPNDFSLFNSEFTGISVAELEVAPTIKTIIPKFLEFIGSDILVGANINSFDINFLYDTILENTKQKLQNNVIDIFRFSRRLLPIEKHRMESICNYLGFYGQHHRAVSDCELTIKCYEYFKNKIRSEKIDFAELFKSHRKHVKPSEIECTVDYIDVDNLFYQKNVAITGTLDVTRKQAQQYIKNMGGVPQGHFRSTTEYLIVGRIKEEETDSLTKARQASLTNKNIKIISGAEFLEYCHEYFANITGDKK